MRSQIKSAVIVGIIVVVAIGALSVYFNSLDMPKSAPIPIQSDNVQTTNETIQPNANTSTTQPIANTPILPPIDESHNFKAPDLAGISGYINTTPEDLKKAMKNKVIFYDFWTYSCINCIRALPYITAWNEKYADKGLLIIGVHSPEFEFEKDINNVKLAVQKFGIKYPVVLDSDHQTWAAFGNQYWPREYITDYQGYIRHDHIGEGNYDETEKVIQQLLDERNKHLGLNIQADQALVNIPEHQFSNSQTPELYFGYNFAEGRNYLGNSEGFNPGQTVTYSLPTQQNRDDYYLEGKWQNLPDSMKLVSDNGKIILSYFAKSVHIVAANNSTLQISLDGNSIKSDYSGDDVQNATVHTSENRLYNIVSTSQAGSHTLIITAKPGFQIYTFTFG
ncbi:MAG TPA: redoxin family protein [Nitrosopumilaceae archaeon]|nr:redoxin family protein [Nitrosopumilaceae archaeon]